MKKRPTPNLDQPGLAECLRRGHDFRRGMKPMSGTLTAFCPRCRASGEYSEFGIKVYRAPTR
jgi:transposase